MIRRVLGGCGCLLCVFAAVIIAFALGVWYAPRVEEKVSNVMETTRDGVKEVDEQIKKTRETAELFYRDARKNDNPEKQQ